MYQIQKRGGDVFLLLTVLEDPVIIIPGHIGDQGFPGHGKERIMAAVTQLQNLRSDVGRPEIPPDIQNQAAGMLLNHGFNEMVQPVRRLPAHDLCGNNQLIAAKISRPYDGFRNIDPVHYGRQTFFSGDQPQTVFAFRFFVNIS